MDRPAAPVTMRPCVYATSGWGIHDDRWTDALRYVGFEPLIIRLGIDVSNPTELRHRVDEVASPNTPVLAGPLESVASHLIGLAAPVIGLSWGFDLHTMSDNSWLPRLHRLIVDSEATMRIAMNAGVRPEAITFLPWGVDIDRFRPDGPRADLTGWGVQQSGRTVLSLRAHEPLYRVEDIVEAFALASKEEADLHLLVGHSGSLTDELRCQARELGIAERTHFIGSIPEADLPDLFRAADVYVSASEVDGTSVTLLQAMACGTSVVASETAGNGPWVRPGKTGYLFATGDTIGLAHRLVAALDESPPVRSQLTHNARALVEDQADWNANVWRLRQALEV